MTFRCPRCASSDELVVVATVWRRLVQEDDEVQTVDPPKTMADEEWDDGSTMMCCSCRHSAPAARFRLKLPSIARCVNAAGATPSASPLL